AGAEEFGVDATIPVGAAKRLEQRPDLVGEQLAAPSGGAGPAVEPLVVTGFRHADPRAHPHHRGSITRILRRMCCALRGDELVFVAHRCSLAKYALAFFRNAFSISSSRLRRSSSRSRARSDNSSGGSSAACVARYFFTQPPTVVSLSPYSRDTSAIDRVVSTTSLATSSRNSGLYFSYFRANSSIPFRSGPYSVRNPEGWRHASLSMAGSVVVGAGPRVDRSSHCRSPLCAQWCAGQRGLRSQPWGGAVNCNKAEK